jgi:putative protease
MPIILKDSIYKNIKADLDNILKDFNIKGFVVSHISQIDLCKKHNLPIVANYSFNIMNTYTINSLNNLGIERFTISPELNKNNIKTLSSMCNSEFIVYGKLPVMTTNYCLSGKTNTCTSACKNKCLNNKFSIKDKLGFIFRALPNRKSTITTIYNSKITSIDFKDLTLNCARIDFLDETFNEMNFVIDKIHRKEKLEGSDYTNGNFKRTV